jgi:hypothetical protein
MSHTVARVRAFPCQVPPEGPWSYSKKRPVRVARVYVAFAAIDKEHHAPGQSLVRGGSSIVALRRGAGRYRAADAAATRLGYSSVAALVSGLDR